LLFPFPETEVVFPGTTFPLTPDSPTYPPETVYILLFPAS